MERSICISCLLIFIGIPLQAQAISYDADTRRHHIYWDSKVSKGIRNPEFSLHVEMGQFMDIICPFTNYGLSDDTEPPAVFDLYNVTEDGFRTCDPTLPGTRMIFSCDLPDQENKLTVKFQRISPSPYGFRFRHCEEYYFIAIKRESPLAPPRGRRKYGCSRESERLRIVVGCPHHKKKSTIETTTTPSTTTVNVHPMLSDDNSVVEPPINPVAEESDEKQQQLPSRAESRSVPDGNSSSRTTPISIVTYVIVTIMTSFWIVNQHTSS